MSESPINELDEDHEFEDNTYENNLCIVLNRESAKALALLLTRLQATTFNNVLAHAANELSTSIAKHFNQPVEELINEARLPKTASISWSIYDMWNMSDHVDCATADVEFYN